MDQIVRPTSIADISMLNQLEPAGHFKKPRSDDGLLKYDSAAYTFSQPPYIDANDGVPLRAEGEAGNPKLPKAILLELNRHGT